MPDHSCNIKFVELFSKPLPQPISRKNLLFFFNLLNKNCIIQSYPFCEKLEYSKLLILFKIIYLFYIHEYLLSYK